MKLVILVPSREHRNSAGARIRYGRIAEALKPLGGELRLETIGDFDPDRLDCDALVISKCHDARSLIAAASASERGALVGVDLFDDYFSQFGDSRLTAYRYWLRELLDLCDFSLCSTAPLAEVANRYRPGIATHIINDPSPLHDPAEAVRLADRKAAEALASGALKLAWFGVGDNPHFEVGLSDLFGQSEALHQLQASGFATSLTIVTNRRALSADRLEMMNRLPVRHIIREWTEAVEEEVLAQSFVAFLPVARQSFSVAKSLNRAWTALSHGCQVLSSGAPIYDVLDALIYRDPCDLIDDLEARRMRLGESSLTAYLEHLRLWADSSNEAAKLFNFLSGLPAKLPSKQMRIAVVHGFSTRGEVDQLVHNVGGLSIRSPFSTAKLPYDVRFEGLPPAMEIRNGPEGVLGGARLRNGDPAGVGERSAGSFAYQMASYASVLIEIKRRLIEMHGSLRLFISDTSRTPVSVPDQ